MRALLLCLLASCVPDDWNGEPYTGPPPTGGSGTTSSFEGTIVGSWRSEGDDLSPLFAEPPFSYVRVDAVFRDDGTYEVTSADASGGLAPLLGTYTAAPLTGASPAVIALVQTTPYAAEASGIYGVTGETLRWEVVQTVPDFGFTPPTPATGFGSTSGPGLTPGMNLQIFVRTNQ